MLALLTTLIHSMHRRAISLGLATLVTMNLAGCYPYPPSSYGPAGLASLAGELQFSGFTGYGYTETKLADDQYAVCFMGVDSPTWWSWLTFSNSWDISKDRLTGYENKARLRAAEITLAQGYTHFVIQSDKTSSVTADDNGELCASHDNCPGPMLLPVDESGNLELVTVYASDEATLVTLHIQLLKSPDSSVAGALDAKSIYDSLAPKYKETLPTFGTRTYDPGYTCGNI